MRLIFVGSTLAFAVASAVGCAASTSPADESDESAAVASRDEALRICPEIVMPVCGVDGHTYTNECFANGEPIAHAGPCVTPPPPKCPPNVLLCVKGTHYDGTPGVCRCVPNEPPPPPHPCPPHTVFCIEGTHYDAQPGVCRCVANFAAE